MTLGIPCRGIQWLHELFQGEIWWMFRLANRGATIWPTSIGAPSYALKQSSVHINNVKYIKLNCAKIHILTLISIMCFMVGDRVHEGVGATA